MTAWLGKGRRAGASLAGIALVALILVLVNVILAGTVLRLDLTQGREFTVSRATRQVLGELHDLVTITVYMSTDMPPQLATLRRQVADILEEYRSFGRGRVQVDFVDPAADPEVERRLQSLGIPQIMAQTIERDQLQVKNIYLGMAIAYLDRREVLPVIESTYNLEYDLTAAILKVSRDEDYTIGILGGPVALDMARDLSSLQQMLQKQYRVRSVSLGAGDEAIPDDIDVLLVAGPTDVPEAVKYRIDQFLMRGGQAVFLIDPIRLTEGGGLQAFPLQSGLEDLLAHYGVRVRQALVLDRALCSQASFSGGYIRYTLPYPYWPKTAPELHNQELPLTSKLESLVFPWVAPLELDVPIAPGDPLPRIRELQASDRRARAEMARGMGVEPPPEVGLAAESGAEADARPEGDAPAIGAAPLRADVLVRTSPAAWPITGRYDLNPQQPFIPGETGAQILAAALTGRFTSFYADRPIPEAATPPPDMAFGAAAEEAPLGESPETRILVVGNAQFVTDSFLGQFPANAVFLLNAVDWMTFGEQLIGIRSRGASERPLAQVSDGAKSRIKLAAILGAPLLIVLAGIARFSLRRRAWAAQEVAAREA
ncbi:MAG: Gldg family protein [Candidatus Eisenbacteria bacterium]|uniref:Gldg family protein n=1 Tax=Eiseniibacteriota bacterium TaxID=2212470 RepID=A0A937X8D7_UNCEI|nr:Gldg family protein [Candidatus Eisenbacteria bacterium]